MHQLPKILITGGVGYIGSHTAIVLSKAGYDLVLFDNLSNSKIEVLDKLNLLLNKQIRFEKGDIQNTSLLIQTIKQYDISTVIHFAGLKAVGESVNSPLKYFDNNVGGTISLLKAMQFTKIEKLLFSSSSTVYGIPQYLPYDEAHPTSVTNPYGRTKLQIEEILTDLANSNPQWRICNLRYFNPIGAHNSGLIGEDPNDIPNNLLPYIAQVAIGKQPHLHVYGNDYKTKDGTGVRDYIHVMDLAEGHLSALRFIENNRGCHAFNLGTGKGYSVFEIIKAFEKVSGKKIAYKICPRRSGDVAISYANASLAKKVLGWEAKMGIEEMCQSSWNFQSILIK